MRRRMTRYWTAAAALTMVSCAAARVKAGELLIYSDQSSGAMVLQHAERQAGIAGGHTVTVVTSPADLLSNLPCEPWVKVVVIYRFTSTEPSYFNDLRSWCTGNRLVQIYSWHDNGTNPSSYSAVIGTTGLALWHQGQTTYTYALASNLFETTTVSGFVTPSFQGITAQNPTPVASLPPEQAANMSLMEIVTALMGIIQDDACLAACRATFLVDVAGAFGQFQTDQTTCRNVYANDVSKLANCLKNAATNYMNAIKAALDRYQVCIDGCAG